MSDAPSSPPRAPGNQQYTALKREVRSLESRLLELEGKVPASNLVSSSFWSRAWAVFGHNLAAILLLHAIIFALWLFLAAVVGS